MHNTITCLIPVYNEGQRLVHTLQELIKVKEINSFVVVDDGSVDNAIELVKNNFPRISLVQLKENQGKSAAVRAGLKQIQTTYTLLFDADINGLDHQEISAGLEKTMNDDYDMIIFRRMRSPITAKLFRADIVLSGERVVKTEILNKVMHSVPKPKSYTMEAVLNQHCINNQYKVGWSKANTYNTFKIYKVGVVSGLWGDFMTMVHGAQRVGWTHYLYQVFCFCRNNA